MKSYKEEEMDMLDYIRHKSLTTQFDEWHKKRYGIGEHESDYVRRKRKK